MPDDPAEPILLMLSDRQAMTLPPKRIGTAREPSVMDDPEFEYKLDTLSHKIEVERLFPLQVKEKVPGWISGARDTRR